MDWTSLWRDLSRSFYTIAVAKGYAGILQPNGLDNDVSSMRKVCFYTAFIADNP